MSRSPIWDPDEWWLTVETRTKCPVCGLDSPYLHSIGQLQDWMRSHRSEAHSG